MSANDLPTLSVTRDESVCVTRDESVCVTRDESASITREVANPVTRDDAHDAKPWVSSRSPAAQRQWAYRQRCKRAAIDAIGEEATASRVSLMSLLSTDLAALESRHTSDPMLRARRRSVRRIIDEIVTRYGIDP